MKRGDCCQTWIRKLNNLHENSIYQVLISRKYETRLVAFLGMKGIEIKYMSCNVWLMLWNNIHLLEDCKVYKYYFILLMDNN